MQGWGGLACTVFIRIQVPLGPSNRDTPFLEVNKLNICSYLVFSDSYILSHVVNALYENFWVTELSWDV